MRGGSSGTLKTLVLLLIIVGLGISAYASRDAIKDRFNLVLDRNSYVEEISQEVTFEKQPSIPPTLEVQEGLPASPCVIESNSDPGPVETPEPTSTHQPPPTLTGEQVFEKYDSGEISLEETKELLQALQRPVSGLTFQGEADNPLIDKSKAILQRVWKGSGQGKSLTVTFTYTPLYDPLADKFNLIKWEDAHRGHATIAIPQDRSEYSAGIVYAATFMVLTLELTQDPNQAPVKELQAIYQHATDEEYQEVLRCFEDLKLSYCAVFIAGYHQGTPKSSVPTVPAPSTPVPTPIAPTTPERGSPEWVTSLETKLHALINQEREKASLDTLANDPELSNIARLHSEDMASNGYFSHENLSGQGPSDRANQANYPCRKDLGEGWYSEGIAENIVQGYTYSSTIYINGIPHRNYSTTDEIANDLVNSWMGSPGHKQNILTKQYDRSGLGVAVDQDGKVYATQNFC